MVLRNNINVDIEKYFDSYDNKKDKYNYNIKMDNM